MCAADERYHFYNYSGVTTCCHDNCLASVMESAWQPQPADFINPQLDAGHVSVGTLCETSAHQPVCACMTLSQCDGLRQETDKMAPKRKAIDVRPTMVLLKGIGEQVLRRARLLMSSYTLKIHSTDAWHHMEPETVKSSGTAAAV